MRTGDAAGGGELKSGVTEWDRGGKQERINGGARGGQIGLKGTRDLPGCSWSLPGGSFNGQSELQGNLGGGAGAEGGGWEEAAGGPVAVPRSPAARRGGVPGASWALSHELDSHKSPECPSPQARPFPNRSGGRGSRAQIRGRLLAVQRRCLQPLTPPAAPHLPSSPESQQHPVTPT